MWLIEDIPCGQWRFFMITFRSVPSKLLDSILPRPSLIVASVQKSRRLAVSRAIFWIFTLSCSSPTGNLIIVLTALLSYQKYIIFVCIIWCISMISMIYIKGNMVYIIWYQLFYVSRCTMYIMHIVLSSHFRFKCELMVCLCLTQRSLIVRFYYTFATFLNLEQERHQKS